MDMSAVIQFGPVQTSPLEMMAVAAGLLCVWFMKKESLWVFPFGIINVVIYVWIFFTARLYANAAINLFFFVMTTYGWYKWTRKDGGEHVLKISRCSRKELWFSALAVLVFFIIIRAVLVRYTESRVPSWDAATTAVYMIAQWMVSHKRIENWLGWIAADTVMIGLCAWEGLWFSSFQYLVFTVIAVLGFIEWRAKLLKG